jgi:hypothetical protein
MFERHFLKIEIYLGLRTDKVAKLLRRDLSEVGLEDFRGKTFEVIHMVEMLCEVCEKPLGLKEKFLRKIQISSEKDYGDFLNRAAAHDRVEVDVENGKIYLYDHDFPGDIHPECVEKL